MYFIYSVFRLSVIEKDRCQAQQNGYTQTYITNYRIDLKKKFSTFCKDDKSNSKANVDIEIMKMPDCSSTTKINQRSTIACVRNCTENSAPIRSYNATFLHILHFSAIM